MAWKDLVGLADGTYTAHVQFIDDGRNDEGRPRRVIAKFVPEHESGQNRTRVGDNEKPTGGLYPLPVAMLDPPIVADMVYEVAVRSGQIDQLQHNWEATVCGTANEIPDTNLIVPLRDLHYRDGPVPENRAMVTLDPTSSLLVAGEPGAGKTEFIKAMTHQLRTKPDEPVIVFNYKDDYTDFAEQLAANEVIRISTRGSTHIWNVFREVEDEEDFERIGKSLFKDREENSTEKKFFPITARQALVAAMKYLHREGQRHGLAPDNRELVDFFDRFTVEEMYELLSEYEDLRGEIAAMNPEATKQSIGIIGTLQSLLQDTFGVGDFRREEGTFSIREYFENPNGRVLVLDYPLEEGDRVTDIFRVFLDRAIQYALADADTQATFVLDEFARIPHVDRMKALVATGRARSVQSIIGVQSIAQLAENYGSKTADSLLSGLTQEVFLRAGDERTLEYYTSRLGVNPNVEASGHGDDDRHPTADPEALWSQLQRLDDGEGYVLKQGGYAHVSVPMLSQLGHDTQAAVRNRTADRTS